MAKSRFMNSRSTSPTYNNKHLFNIHEDNLVKLSVSAGNRNNEYIERDVRPSNSQDDDNDDTLHTATMAHIVNQIEHEDTSSQLQQQPSLALTPTFSISKRKKNKNKKNIISQGRKVRRVTISNNKSIIEGKEADSDIEDAREIEQKTDSDDEFVNDESKINEASTNTPTTSIWQASRHNSNYTYNNTDYSDDEEDYNPALDKSFFTAKQKEKENEEEELEEEEEEWNEIIINTNSSKQIQVETDVDNTVESMNESSSNASEWLEL